MADSRYNEEDYIRLESVKRLLLEFTRGFFSVIDRIAVKFREFWLLILLLSTSGVGIGYLLSRVVNYNSELTMLVKFNDMTRSTYSNMISSLNDLATSRSYDRLATEMDIRPSDAAQISDVILEEPKKDDALQKDDTSQRVPLQVVISLRSITVSDAVQKGFLAFLNGSPYLKSLKSAQLTYYREELSFIDGELRKLDSLKVEYNKSINSGKTATIYYNAFNPAEIYSRSFALMQEKQNLIRWFATEQDAVSLISAIKQDKLVKKRSGNVIVLGFITGFVISLLIIGFRELRQAVRQSASLPSTQAKEQ